MQKAQSTGEKGIWKATKLIFGILLVIMPFMFCLLSSFMAYIHPLNLSDELSCLDPQVETVSNFILLSIPLYAVAAVFVLLWLTLFKRERFTGRVLLLTLVVALLLGAGASIMTGAWRVLFCS